MHGVAKLGPFRHLDPDLALAVAVFSTQEARRLDLAAQGGGGHRDGNLAEQIEPVALEKLMRFDREEDVEIAARAAAGARVALAGQPDSRAVVHAGRDSHL